jgi:hypothetical protein
LISGSNDRQIKVWNVKEERETKENKDTKETKEVTVTNAQLVYQIYTPQQVKKC